MSTPRSITIIGTGNVASHLCVALAGKTDELYNISSRTPEEIPLDSDLYILAVSDDAIPEVAARMPSVKGVVAHTAGSVAMQTLSPCFDRIGVLYPLQTFTKGVDVDYSEIPVFIEGNSPETVSMLSDTAALFSRHIYPADSERRRLLHVASVFACNYVNGLWCIADDMLRKDGLSLEVLLPLIKATASKITRMSPAEAQTGPASRGDTGVMRSHLQMLQDNPTLSEIYRRLGDNILTRSGHKPLEN